MPRRKGRKPLRGPAARKPAPVYRETARCKLCLKVYVIRPGPGAGRPRDFCREAHATLWWRFHHPRKFDREAGAAAAARWRLSQELGQPPPKDLEGPERPGVNLPEGPPDELTQKVIERLAKESAAVEIVDINTIPTRSRCPLCRESLSGVCGAHRATNPFA